MKNGPAVKTVLFLGGLLLGLIVYAIALTGFGLSAVAVLYARTTVQAPPTDIAAGSVTTLEQEVSAVLAGASLGGSATVSEESVNRLLRIGITQGRLPEKVTLHAFHLDLNPSAVILSATATITPLDSIGRFRLKPQTTRLEMSLQVQPQREGLLFSLDRATVGSLTLPEALIAALGRRFEPVTPDLPISKSEDGSFFLSYDALKPIIPPALVLEALVVREGYVVAQLSVSEDVRRHLVSHVAPLLDQQAGAAREAAAAALGIDNPVSRSIDRVVSKLSTPPLPPSEPTALVSYRERDVEATPPDGATFSPAVGTDLAGGTLLRTGAASYVECILRDKTMLRVDQNTQVHLKELPSSPEDARGRFDLLTGRLRARVATITGTDYRFSAAENVCGVRGTDLVLDLSPDQTLRLSVLEGSVVLVPPEGTELPVDQDQAILTTAGAAPAVLTPDDRKTIEAELLLRTDPGDAARVREIAWLWDLLNEAKDLAIHIMALEGVSKERLGAEMRRRIDAESLRPHLESFLKDLGVEDSLAWLDSMP